MENKTEETKLYKVYKVGRISHRKNLSLSDAQAVVKSYKSSTRSMVCYTAQ